MPTPNYYPLYEHWYKTMNWLLDRCDRMPKHLRFTISGRMVTMATDIAELLLEAIYAKEKSPKLLSINLQLEKLRLYCRLCKDRHYFTLPQYEYISREINEAGKMCGGWIKNQQAA
ncbi:diversity-generating retroelement protein Avd [Haliscomenobacter sp.]|uniref:diversity-generating retroelement protein Avd n=1 Tax=Haliscomenobacter sp. TaxID=2717303 RepID=UPI003593F9D5